MISPEPPTPRRAWLTWRELHPVAQRLIQTRALRSVAQGALTVDFVLYLKALGWSAPAIGLLLAATSGVSAALSLAGGIATDRFGRRSFILGYQVATFALTVCVLVSPARWVLVGAAVLLGYGRGANGSAGPFGPAEQAWLAHHSPAADRGRIFSLNSAAAFVGMGIGALLGAGVPLVQGWLPGTEAYRALFVVTAIVAVANYFQLAAVREERDHPAPAAPPQGEGEVRRRENRAMALLVGVNAVNSLGIGLFGPLLPYWFALRYGAGPGAIGPVFAVGFLLAGVSSLVTGELTARVGLVKSVVVVRLIGVLGLFALPLMPTFAWAAALYTVRSVLNRGSSGARQAFSVSLVRNERRGLAGSLNNLSFRLPGAIGPAIGGWLMGLGDLDLPFYLAAVLQLGYVVLFGTIFRGATIAEEG